MSNNSKFALDSMTLTEAPKVDTKPPLREREQKLLNTIEALQGVQKTKAWSTLKEEVFDALVESLEKEIRHEAKEPNPDTNKLNRLTGQLKWAEKYSDLSKLEASFRVELTNIRLNLYGKTELNG